MNLKTDDVRKILVDWDRKGRYVYLKRDLAKLICDPSENTFNETLRRLVKNGTLVRAAYGTYVFADSAHIGGATLDLVALALRRGEYVFESLESAASQWGDISQIPIDRVTYMTTGRSGEYHTPYGVIEFVHTASDPNEFLSQVVARSDRPVPIASQEYTLKNLERTGRSTDLLVEQRSKGGHVVR